jgi:hypothetical protein
MLSLLTVFAPSVTILLVPKTVPLTMTTTLHVLAASPRTDAAPLPDQLVGHVLSAVTIRQQQTVPTTGQGHHDAQAAHGSITFYNAAPYEQTVAAGTLLTGMDGVQVVTDVDATLPAGTLATNGQRTVAAHAVLPGPAGNIRAGDIYGACCRLNVFAVNSAFTGGTDGA